MNYKKIFSFALGPFVSAFLGMLSIPLMAWFFPPEDIGRMNLLNIVLSFCLLLSVLGLDIAYVREYHGSDDRSRLLKACFAPGFLLLLLSGFGTIAFAKDLVTWLFDIADTSLYLITLLCIFLNHIARFSGLIFRMQERGLAFSMSQIMQKALQLILLCMVIWFGLERNFITILWITLASMVVAVFLFAWNGRAEWSAAIKAEYSAAEIRKLLKFGLPLIFSGVAFWGLTATSVLVLRAQSTFDELGVYSVTSSIAGVAAVFQSIFTVIWGPTVFKWVNQGVDMARLDTITRYALFAFCVIFVSVGCFSWLTDYLVPAHYINVKYLVVCAITPALLYTFSEITGIGITISRRTIFSLWVAMVALVTNVLLCIWLVPFFGAAGAVMANGGAYSVFFFARTEASAFVWRQFPRARMYVFTSMAVALSVGTVALGGNLPFHYALVWLALAPVVVWCFRAELAELIAACRSALGQQVKSRNAE